MLRSALFARRLRFLLVVLCLAAAPLLGIADTHMSFDATIVSLNSGLCVNAGGNAQSSSLALVQGQCGSLSQTLFSFSAQSDGSYILHSPVSANLCADLDDDGKFVQNFCLPTSSQRWTYSASASGTYSLVNLQNHRCLSAGSTVLSMATCSSAVTQHFLPRLTTVFARAASASAPQPPAVPVQNPTAGNWQAGVYNGLLYRILFPSGYDPARYRYPLALFLHGSGESGSDNIAQLKNDMTALAKDLDFRAKAPLILVAPQCPTTDNWGSAGNAKPTATETLTVALVQALTASLAVDPARVSVTGLSMGGVGSWDMINRYPKVFAAAAPLAGATSVSTAQALAKVPLLAVHGAKDGNISPSYDQAMYNTIHRLNGPMLFYEIADTGHDVWDIVYPMTAFWQWVYAQKHI